MKAKTDLMNRGIIFYSEEVPSFTFGQLALFVMSVAADDVGRWLFSSRTGWFLTGPLTESHADGSFEMWTGVCNFF